MTHLDEGMLHAYLDGEGAAGTAESGEAWAEQVEQHLASCAECRARLEQVRRLRDRAADVLRAAGPAHISAPPFEEVLARSRHEGTRRRVVSLNRLRTLAWAATLILAVGLGWFARGSLRPPSQPATPMSAGAERSDVPSAEISAPPAEVTDSRPTAAAARPEARYPGGRAALQRMAEPAAGAPTPEPVPPAAPALQVQGALADADERAQEEPKIETPVRNQLRAMAPAAKTREAAVVTDAAAEQELLRRTRRGDVSVGPLASRARPESWTPVNEATAQTFLEGPIVIVEGLPVIGYATGIVGGRRAVRVNQDLGSGELLELFQEALSDLALEQARERDPEITVADSVTALSARRGDYLITIRGPLSADSLRALLRRIR